MGEFSAIAIRNLEAIYQDSFHYREVLATDHC